MTEPNQVAPSAVAEMRARAELAVSSFDDGTLPAELGRDVLALADALAAVTAERDDALRVGGECQRQLRAREDEEARASSLRQLADEECARADRLAGQVAQVAALLQRIRDGKTGVWGDNAYSWKRRVRALQEIADEALSALETVQETRA